MEVNLPTPIDFITAVAAAGDTFDMLALDYYNDELLSSLIIHYNPQHAGAIRFEQPTTLIIPIINEKDTDALPAWRK